MLNKDDVLYFSSYGVISQTKDVWLDVFNNVPWHGQWYLKVSEKVMPNRLISRNGAWSMPWPQELYPKFRMPDYDPTFNKTFAEVSDEKALRIRDRIRQGERFGVLWSGGIDSTVIMTSLVKNLTPEELENVTVMCSGESMIENPSFYRNFIYGKLKTLNSKEHKYDDMLNLGITPITGDEGDCIFGTLIGLNMYNNFDALLDRVSSEVKENVSQLKNKFTSPDVHYSQFKELIIQYLNIPWHPEFGRILYDKYDHNIKTATVPVHSLHDFFWWLIFNVKYYNCSVRGPIYFNDTMNPIDVIDRTENWYNDQQYQLWSMANNNNGMKIHTGILSYKHAAKSYIYEFDKNEWYFTFKSKLESMWNVTNLQTVQHLPMDRRPAHRIAIKKQDHEVIYIGDPGVKEYFVHHLSNYKIDWTETPQQTV